MWNDADPDFRFISGYELLRPIGRGGMGVAYLATQLSLGRQVVVKILSQAPDVDPVEQAVRFRREAELMARISHPHVTKIFDFGIEEGRPFLVMEYVEGGDLRRQMTAGKPMPVERVRELLRPLLRALEFLHRNGILHRDMKPENILMDHDDTPKVTDFGIAVLGTSVGSLTRSQQALGTIGYVAPEQQYRLPVDERADQYSLAALTYEMLTGQLPLGAFQPPSRLNRKVHPSVDAVPLRALSEDRHDRYPTMRAFGDALNRALAVPRRRLFWTISAIAIVVVFALMAVRARRQRNPKPVSPPLVAAVPNFPKAVDQARDRELANEGDVALGPDAGGDEAESPPREGDAIVIPALGPDVDDDDDKANKPRLANVIVDKLGMTLVRVSKGEFLMGSSHTDPTAAPDEKPQRRVRIEHSFYLGAHEVTVGQFHAFVKATNYVTTAEINNAGGWRFDNKLKQVVNDPSLNWRNPGLWRKQDDDEPVVQVSWKDADEFCQWRTREEGVEYRLPTEAEWEYACRAGNQGLWCFGDNPDMLGDYAWLNFNSKYTTNPVGRKRPNAFGLYDMHGNVWEWCRDRYAAGADAGVKIKPTGDYVLRGGSWDFPKVEASRSAKRSHRAPDYRYFAIGFRVRRSNSPPAAVTRSP